MMSEILVFEASKQKNLFEKMQAMMSGFTLGFRRNEETGDIEVVNYLKEEMMKRDFFLKNIEKDEKWNGGSLIVSFTGGTSGNTSN